MLGIFNDAMGSHIAGGREAHVAPGPLVGATALERQLIFFSRLTSLHTLPMEHCL